MCNLTFLANGKYMGSMNQPGPLLLYTKPTVHIEQWTSHLSKHQTHILDEKINYLEFT